MAQQAVEKRGLQNHELARTGRMAFYGGCEFPAARPSNNDYAASTENRDNTLTAVGQ